MGRLDPNEAQEESILPDEWVAVRYGWGHLIADEQPRDPGADSDSWSSTDHGGDDGKDGEEKQGFFPPSVKTEEIDINIDGKGKHGGKFRLHGNLLKNP